MLAMSTDLEVPKDVGAVGINIETNGNPIYSSVTEVVDVNGRNIVRLPATFAIKAPKDGTARARIRIVAYKKEGKLPLVLRQAISQVPPSRIALLRMPLEFVNLLPGTTVEGTTTVASRGLKLLANPRCADLVDGYPSATCIDDGCGGDETLDRGVCVKAEVDVASLPEFTEAAVFGEPAVTGPDAGGAGGRCFDVLSCAGAAVGSKAPWIDVPFDKDGIRIDAVTNTCVVALGDDVQSGMQGDRGIDPTSCADFASKLNVSVRGGNDDLGQCVDGFCYTTLTAGSFSFNESGPGGRSVLTIPRSVCARLLDGNASRALRLSYGCQTRPEGTPSCGSSDVGRDAITPMISSTCGGNQGRDGGFPFPDGGFNPILAQLGEPFPSQIQVLNGRAYVASQGGKVTSFSTTAPLVNGMVGGFELVLNPQMNAEASASYAMDVGTFGFLAGVAPIVALGRVGGLPQLIVARNNSETKLYNAPAFSSPMQGGVTLLRNRFVAIGAPNNDKSAFYQLALLEPISMILDPLPAEPNNFDVMTMGTKSGTDGYVYAQRNQLIYEEATNPHPEGSMNVIANMGDFEIKPGKVLDIRVRGDDVFFTFAPLAGGATDLYRATLTGTTATLITDVSIPADPMYPRGRLAVDDKCVYVTSTQSEAPGEFSIQCALYGSPGAAKVRVPTGNIKHPWAVAVDESNNHSEAELLYFVDPVAGQVAVTRRPPLPPIMR